MSAPDLEFVYVGDPMCSWCWGFQPVVDALGDRFEIPIRIVVGGLRPGPAAGVMDDALRRTLASHWHHVAEASGQPFDETPLGWEGWRYDTELPAIATVTMRQLDPKAALEFFTRLQRAFYAEATDVTDPAAYPALLEDFVVDPDRFVELLGSDRMKEAAWADFRFARKMGVTGFPTLLLREGDAHHVVTHGWAPFDRLEPALTAWLESQFGEAASGLLCPIDEPC